MKLLRRTLRYLFRGFLGILAFIILYFLTAWICTFFRSNSSADNTRGEVAVFVRTNGVHTDIIMPVRKANVNWFSVFDPAHTQLADTNCTYVSVGWGDKGFYLETPAWADLKFSTAFKAMFWLGSGAMHVTYQEETPELSERCRKVMLPEKNYEQLCRSICRDLLIADSLPVHIDHPGYGSMDAFYESTRTYNLFQTCNVWTGDRLREAGAAVAPWTPFDWGVFSGL